jgi:hypothetical protein
MTEMLPLRVMSKRLEEKDVALPYFDTVLGDFADLRGRSNSESGRFAYMILLYSFDLKLNERV